MTTKAAVAIAKMKDVGKASYVRWAHDLVKFAKLQSIDRNNPKYAAFRDVLAVVSMHRRFTISKVPGEKNGHAYVSGHLLSIRGKCALDGKAVCSVVHETDEAYTFLVVRGKCWLKTPFNKWDPETTPDPPTGGIDDPFSVLGIKEKSQKGEKLPESTVESGLTWSWNDELHKKYKELYTAVGTDNATRKGLPTVTAPPRFDVFSYPEVTKADKKRFLTPSGRNRVQNTRRRAAIPATDLRTKAADDEHEVSADPWADGSLVAV